MSRLKNIREPKGIAKLPESEFPYIHQNRAYFFLRYLIEENKHMEDMICVEDTITSLSRKQQISIDSSNPPLPKDTKKMIKECRKRFIFLILTFKLPKAQLRHANLIIIDNDTKTCQRFETYGSKQKNGDLDHERMEKMINKHLISLLGSKYKFISVEKTNIPIGLQEKIAKISSLNEKMTGVCLPLSVLMLNLKILNPEVDIKEIQEYLDEKDTLELHKYLLKYVTYIFRYTPDMEIMKIMQNKLFPYLHLDIIYNIVNMSSEIPNMGRYMGRM